ncbi:MAG: peptide chain release factor N(5)-glutamine methyltransferase [Sedimentisphaerales bacterium]|nr:peptide chain release factor N(5)-glutamine methyltransferase [Sedimentisphaerales bacterium]
MTGNEPWTIRKLLNWVTEYLKNKGVDVPRLSAELLLSHVLGLKRIELYTQFNKAVESEQLSQLRELVKRASEHEPIAYLTGKREFYSLDFEITGDCLIPRPETELLVERAIEFLRARDGRQPAVSLPAPSVIEGPNPYVCDLCTGCACVAVAIARNFANCRIVATDISDAALEVAERNITRHGLGGRIELLRGDLFEPIIPGLGAAKFDLIVCNPPYVSEPEFKKLAKNVRDFEPKVALAAGADGLDIIKRVIADAGQFLKPASALMLEIGNEQGPVVHKLLEATGCFDAITIEKDYNKLDRLAIAVMKQNELQCRP